ncbi:hypothetical protein PO909_000643, partial [Leuciscus waleckii]
NVNYSNSTYSRHHSKLSESSDCDCDVVVAASFALLLLALILWVIRKKRAGNRRGTGDSVEQTDDVTYTEVAAYSKKRGKKNKVL